MKKSVDLFFLEMHRRSASFCSLRFCLLALILLFCPVNLTTAFAEELKQGEKSVKNQNNVDLRQSLMPILTYAAYPIYEDDIVSSQQSEPLAQESLSEKELAKNEKSEKESTEESDEDKIAQKSIKGSRLKRRAILGNKESVSSQTKPKPPHSEKKSSDISKRDLARRNPSLPAALPRLRYRQNPNRPHVIHRYGKKQPKNLSQTEADADGAEEELSASKDDGEWASSESDTAQEPNEPGK